VAGGRAYSTPAGAAKAAIFRRSQQPRAGGNCGQAKVMGSKILPAALIQIKPDVL
jgi:hypothetical protein